MRLVLAARYHGLGRVFRIAERRFAGNAALIGNKKIPMKTNLQDTLSAVGVTFSNELIETWAEFLTLPAHPRPIYRAHLLNTAALDYSVNSLRHVDGYLELLRRAPLPPDQILRVIIRCGAYAGEVIRRACPPSSCNWISYEDAARLDSRFGKRPLGPENFVSLYHTNGTVAWPFGKVWKRLGLGEQESVQAFAELVILIQNLPKDQSDEFFKTLDATAGGAEAFSMMVCKSPLRRGLLHGRP
jgi:hypothetical protein